MPSSAPEQPDSSPAGTPAPGAPPMLGDGIPPSVPPPASPSSLRRWLAVLLSLCLGLFLADAVIGLADDSAAIFLGNHPLSVLRILVSLFAMLLAALVYVLMALTPAIPKRLFVPVALFYLTVALAGLPITLLCQEHLTQIAWGISLVQVGLGIGLLALARRGLKFGRPLVPLEQLGSRNFSWWNLAGFSLANIFGLLPAVVLYLLLCVAGLVAHFTDGFMTLHPGGFQVQVRKYVRADGKTIQLFPMSHVAEGDFYRDIARTFPTNSLILLEGVTDEKHLLQHKINYQRMAQSLGLAEQQKQFEPTRGEKVAADVDVSQFTTNTLALLNLIISIHAGQWEAGTFQKLANYSAAPEAQTQLLDDLLQKRNQHLLTEIQRHLLAANYLVVPWGVAHMPGLAREIQKSGFHLTETQDYMVIRFHGAGLARP